MVDRSRTKAPRGNRGPTPTGHDKPDDGPTAPTDDSSIVTIDPDADTQVVAGVTHYHAGERSFHRQGLDPHWHQDHGEIRWGEWIPAGAVLWEYTGLGHADDHRHDSRINHHHDRGQFEHMHDPKSNDLVMLAEQDQIRDPEPEPAEDRDGGEVEASRVRHPSGHEPTDEVLPSYAAEIERQLAETRAARDRLEAIPTPLPPATPIREGAAQHGTSIAHPGALNLLNTVHHVKDDGLNHEMTWLSILLPLAVEIATYHADNRAEGGAGPELAPMELLMRTRDALEHIVLPRLAREAHP